MLSILIKNFVFEFIYVIKNLKIKFLNRPLLNKNKIPLKKTSYLIGDKGYMSTKININRAMNHMMDNMVVL
jgi:hypothetical protein